MPDLALSPSPKLPSTKRIPAAWFKAALRDSGVHAAELGRRIGVSPVTTSRWKHGSQAIERGRWLEIVAALTELPEGWDPEVAVERLVIEPAPRARIVRRYPREGAPQIGAPNRVPLLDLAAAAGAFAGTQDVDFDTFIDVEGLPGGTANVVAGRVAGHSMEPHLQHGDLVAFRKSEGEPRNGRVYLVQRLDEVDSDTGGRYAVKKLQVDNRFSADNDAQVYVTLVSLNDAKDETGAPVYPPRRVPLGDDGFSVVAELVAVLDEAGPAA